MAKRRSKPTPLFERSWEPPPMPAAPPPEPVEPAKPIDLPPARLAALIKGEQLRDDGQALPLLWLPEPQERWLLPPSPTGLPVRTDGKFWFEK